MLSFKKLSKKSFLVARLNAGQPIYMDPDGDALREKENDEKICEYCDMKFYRKYEKIRHQKLTCQFEPEKKTNKNGICYTKSEITIDENSKIMFEPICRTDIREIQYITGTQGVGKSTYASKYALQYQDTFPNNEVFLFTRIDEDPTYDDKIDDLNRIVIDEQLLVDPIDAKYELAGSLVIMDDIDGGLPSALNREIIRIINDIAKNGRDQTKTGNDIYLILTYHLLSDYKKSRDILNECTSLTLFPKGANGPQAKKFLKYYMDLSKTQISKILNSKSRWVTIYKTHPRFVLTEKSIYLI